MFFSYICMNYLKENKSFSSDEAAVSIYILMPQKDPEKV